MGRRALNATFPGCSQAGNLAEEAADGLGAHSSRRCGVTSVSQISKSHLKWPFNAMATAREVLQTLKMHGLGLLSCLFAVVSLLAAAVGAGLDSTPYFLVRGFRSQER